MKWKRRSQSDVLTTGRGPAAVRHPIPRAAIEASVDWWGRQFRSPEPLEDHYSGTALLIAKAAGPGEPPGVEQIAAFRGELAAMLGERADRISDLPAADSGLVVRHDARGLKVRIDYDPDPILEAALEHAGIRKWWLPRDAETWTFPQCIAAGVGGRRKIIWHDPALPPLTCRVSVGGGTCALNFLHDGSHEPG